MNVDVGVWETLFNGIVHSVRECIQCIQGNGLPGISEDLEYQPGDD